MNINEYEKRYETKDIYFGAVLLAFGSSLLSLKTSSNNQVTFVFDINKDFAEDLALRHFSGKLDLPTKDVLSAFKELKTRIHMGV